MVIFLIFLCNRFLDKFIFRLIVGVFLEVFLIILFFVFSNLCFVFLIIKYKFGFLLNILKNLN